MLILYINVKQKETQKKIMTIEYWLGHLHELANKNQATQTPPKNKKK